MNICAVVVTYNRLEELKKCISSLKTQTRKPDSILVINNSSTDGTIEWLSGQQDLEFITQPNSGGAGGFYTGIKIAYEKGYDWVWCMDDDALPTVDCLEKLVGSIDPNELCILNSLVVNSADKTKLAFGLYAKIHNQYYERINQITEQIFYDDANFFNGTLIPRRFIEKFGLPNKNYFIRGDETEYFLRAITNGIKVCTVTNSIIYHPGEESLLVENMIFRHKFLLIDDYKRNYSTRNIIILFRIYGKQYIGSLVKLIIFDFLYIIFYQKSFTSLKNFIKGFFIGIVAKKSDFE